MQLHRTDILCHGAGDSTVDRVEGCKVWYVHDGRNAWHSTWVQRYSEGCMHGTLASAKDYCETKRKSGSVFYVNEIPAIRVFTQIGFYTVIQINAKNPFERYRSQTESDGVSDPSSMASAPQQLLFIRGAPVAAALESFYCDSKYWEIRPDPESVVLTWRARFGQPNLVIELSAAHLKKGTQLSRYVSSSVGADYYLQWAKVPHSIRKKGALDLLRRVEANEA